MTELGCSRRGIRPQYKGACRIEDGFVGSCVRLQVCGGRGGGGGALGVSGGGLRKMNGSRLATPIVVGARRGVRGRLGASEREKEVADWQR